MDRKELKQRIIDELGYKIVQLPNATLWKVFRPGSEKADYLAANESDAWDWIPNWPRSSDLALQLPIPDGWRWTINCTRSIGYAKQFTRYDVYLFNKDDPFDYPIVQAENTEDLAQTICLLWLQYRKEMRRQEHYGHKPISS